MVGVCCQRWEFSTSSAGARRDAPLAAGLDAEFELPVAVVAPRSVADVNLAVTCTFSRFRPKNVAFHFHLDLSRSASSVFFDALRCFYLISHLLFHL